MSFAPFSTMSAWGRPSRGSRRLRDRLPLTWSVSLSGFVGWPSALAVLRRYVNVKATTSPAELRHCAFQRNDWVVSSLPRKGLACVLQPARREDGWIGLTDWRGSGFQ